MIGKRFDFEDEYITLDGGVFTTAKNKNDAELISKTLNQLYDENGQLKQQNRGLQGELQDKELGLSLWNAEDTILEEDKKQLQKENKELKKENEQLKQQIEELEFKLRTIEAYDRTVKEEHSDTVYDFKKKLEKW